MAEVRALRVEVVHAIPGRIRLRLQGSADAAELEEAAQLLQSLSGVLEARGNPWARSMSIAYDLNALDLGAMTAAAERAGFQIDIAVPPASGDEPPSDDAPVARPAEAMFNGLDRRILAVSGGITDLRSLVPATLGALALREVVAGRVVAVPWYALLYYAFDSYVKLRRPSSDAPDPVQR